MSHVNRSGFATEPGQAGPDGASTQRRRGPGTSSRWPPSSDLLPARGAVVDMGVKGRGSPCYPQQSKNRTRALESSRFMLQGPRLVRLPPLHHVQFGHACTEEQCQIHSTKEASA